MTEVASGSQRFPGPTGQRYDYISLQFCKTCETAYSIQIMDGQQRLYCRNCSFSEPTDLIVVHRTSYENKEMDKEFMINANTRYDVTLPVCTVEKCPACGHSDSKFMKVHDDKMALMFFCLNKDCGTIWRK